MRRSATTIASLMMTTLVHATVQAQDLGDSAEAYWIDEAMLQELAEIEATAAAAEVEAAVAAEVEAPEVEAMAGAEAAAEAEFDLEVEVDLEVDAVLDAYQGEVDKLCPRDPYPPWAPNEVGACFSHAEQEYGQQRCMGERALREELLSSAATFQSMLAVCSAVALIAPHPGVKAAARLCQIVQRVQQYAASQRIQEAYEEYVREVEKQKDDRWSACEELLEGTMAERSSVADEGSDPNLIPDVGVDPADLAPPSIALIPADQPTGRTEVIECAPGDPDCEGQCFSTHDGRICCYQEAADSVVCEDGSNSGS